MELWWRIRGWVRLRLTSADCTGRLRVLAKQVRLEDIRFSNDLTVEFTICKRDRDKVHVRDGDSLELVCSGGFRDIWRYWAGGKVLRRRWCSWVR